MDFRAPVSAAAAVASGGLAGFVLTNPRNRAWIINASDREIDRWLSSQPTGVVAALVLAVVTVAGLQRSGSRRASWLVAALCALVLIGARWAVPQVSGIDALIVLHFAKTSAAGILIGCAVAAVWGRWWPQLALTLGVAIAFVLASVQRLPRAGADYLEPATESTSTIGEPPLWLLLGVLLLTLMAAALAQPRFRVQTPEGTVLLTALVGALVLAVLNRVLGAWIDDQEFGEPMTVWMIVALSIAVLLASTAVIAHRFTQVDGRFLLTATGATAAAVPVLDDLRVQPVTTSAPALLAVGVLALVAGIGVAVRVPPHRRKPEWGLSLSALVPLVSAIWPAFGEDSVSLLLELVLLNVGIGFALAAALPVSAPVAALGFVLPFASLVFVSATNIPRSRVVYSGEYDSLGQRMITTGFDERLPSSPASAAASDHLAGVAMLLVVGFCIYWVREQHRAWGETQQRD
ncbi:hypothetical protein BFN03_13125 [Rhodococcus sp. WMMA185]|uniref:hypothetical protein n=1 Tax=Rhodococcus sp. WMMA185 TaxID=679318 RepID=UPI000878659B|nr:hypothetical protein [Rhodococcus sp. WMMA185]AOW93274.1 hypothetical protein BFN03_13125 [Rhodococcus sp. WMMA185]